MKTLPKTLCLLAFSVSFSYAGTASADTPSKPLRIGAFFQEIKNPYFVTMKDALQDAGGSIGAQLIITDARHDVSKQVSDIEDMLQKGIDILIINPTDSVGVQSAIKSAHAAGVVVVAAIPLGRFAESAEVALPVLFLLSAGASMISGVSVPVDGGYTAR